MNSTALQSFNLEMDPKFRFKNGRCEGTEAISPFAISIFTARSPRTLQVLAMTGWEKGSFSKSGWVWTDKVLFEPKRIAPIRFRYV